MSREAKEEVPCDERTRVFNKNKPCYIKKMAQLMSLERLGFITSHNKHSW